MDDYRDVAEMYLRSLEKIILEAGLKLPGVYGNISKEEAEKVAKLVTEIRFREIYK